LSAATTGIAKRGVQKQGRIRSVHGVLSHRIRAFQIGLRGTLEHDPQMWSPVFQIMLKG